MGKLHRYTEEEVQFFKDYTKGHSQKEIQEEFIKRFGWNITIRQIKAKLNLLGLKTGTNNYFQKGHISHNKGKPMPDDVKEKLKPFKFKKGNLPPRHQEVGTETITSKGFVKVKIAEPNIWKYKHKLMYEKYHNVELSNKDIVIFIDNDKSNFSKKNLVLVNKSIMLDINNNLNFHTDDVEIRKAVIALAKARYELKMKKQELRKE
jgi:hypothetical protein